MRGAMAAGLLGLSLLPADCYESPKPFFATSQAIADPSVVGTWRCSETDEPKQMSTATVSANRRRQYTIELSAPGLKNVRFRGFITRSGGSTIFNVQQLGASDLIDRDQYAAVRYEHQADGSLDMAVLKSRTNEGDVFAPLLRCVRRPA